MERFYLRERGQVEDGAAARAEKGVVREERAGTALEGEGWGVVIGSV